MPLKLLTLNIEASRHRERVRAALEHHLPDVACLQEVLAEDRTYFQAAGGYSCLYADSALLPDDADPSVTRRWGLAILARVPVEREAVIDYSLDPTVRVLDEPNAPRRKVLVVEARAGDQVYRIITTHYTWSAMGLINEQQREDFTRLKAALSRYDDYVLCGDLNSPRGGEMFSLFERELGLVDHLPPEVTTTIDAQYHHAGALQLAVDTIFSTSAYSTSSFEVLEGLSDHKALLATLIP